MEFEHELVIPNEGFPFRLFQFEGKDGNYIREKHWHRSIEIFAVFEGNLNVYLDENKYHIQEGDFLLLNSNEVHSIISPTPNKTIVLQIPLQIFKNYYLENSSFLIFTHQKKEEDGQIMELLKEMYDSLCQKEMGYEWLIQSKFFELLYLLIRIYRREEISKESIKYHKKLDKLSLITSYIRENYKKELSLEALAEIFGYSPSYLSRMFQKYAKINYKTYLQNVRLEYALYEFTHTDHTIAEIALNHGFPNSKAFTKEFKRKYNILPSEYKKGQKSAIE